MANVLSKDKQTAVIGALAEGSSIRSIERITGIQNKKRHVTVFAIHPVISAADAVRAAILRDYKYGTAEEA